MTAGDEELKSLLLGEVLSQQAAVAVAERELNELGISSPSLADIMAWSNSTRKETRAASGRLGLYGSNRPTVMEESQLTCRAVSENETCRQVARAKPHVVEALELLLKAGKAEAQANIYRATARSLLVREIDERKQQDGQLSNCRKPIPIGHMDEHGKGRCDTSKVAKSTRGAPATRRQLEQLGTAVAKQTMQREKVAKELDQVAERFTSQAMNIGNVELRSYYLSKARSARDKAAAIRAGKVER